MTCHKGTERAFFFILGDRREWVVKATPPPFYPRE
jgi:hypothetical protein